MKSNVPKNINLDGKRFKLLENTSNGQVHEETIFYYSQTENKFKAEYHDDNIIYGSIVGHINSHNDIYMTYHCILANGEVKIGEASAIATLQKSKIKLSLNWKWLKGADGHGVSEYLEI